MSLKSDPISHVNALRAAGRHSEALPYINGVYENLSRTLEAVSVQRIKVLCELFELAAARGDIAEATVHYRSLAATYKDVPLADARVEARYFRACFATGNRPVPMKRKHRHLALIEQLRSVFHLPGEIVECGCFRGLSSWMLCDTLNEENGGFDGTGFHIFDSFAGLSDPAPEDLVSAGTEDRTQMQISQMLYKGRFAYSEEKVRRNLAAFPGIAYHAGWLPQSLQGQPERSYRFVHVDVDLYEPSQGVLEYFYPRLVPGGVILTDDYAWPGSRRAFDQFSSQHGLSLQKLPGDQAFLRK